MGPMAKSLSEDFDQWAFVTGRHRRAPPWQNAYAERLIGSIRRECLDHVVVFGEQHLRHILLSYMKYHNEVRTHLSLEKDARAVERSPKRVPRLRAPNVNITQQFQKLLNSLDRIYCGPAQSPQ